MLRRGKSDRLVINQWLEAWESAQSGRFEDLEADLGMLSEEQWNTMVKAAEDAWEKVRDYPKERVRRSGLWNQRHADEAYDPAFLPALEALVGVHVAAGGRP